MQTKIEIKERQNKGLAVIDFPNGKRITVSVFDEGYINVNSSDGSIIIYPYMGNDIMIKIAEN